MTDIWTPWQVVAAQLTAENFELGFGQVQFHKFNIFCLSVVNISFSQFRLISLSCNVSFVFSDSFVFSALYLHFD